MGNINRVHAANHQGYYHVCLEIVSENAGFKNSRLHFTPAENEYRAKTFKTVFVTGTTDETENTYSASLKNAISEVLLAHGLQSVKTVSDNVNFHTDEKTVVRYEGVVILPAAVMDRWEHMDHGQKVYAYDFRFSFSPIAYPDEWSYLYYKKEVIDGIEDFFSLIFY